jgi:hypothetical protein
MLLLDVIDLPQTSRPRWVARAGSPDDIFVVAVVRFL